MRRILISLMVVLLLVTPLLTLDAHAAVWKFTTPQKRDPAKPTMVDGIKITNIENMQFGGASIMFQLGNIELDEQGNEKSFDPIETRRFQFSGPQWEAIANQPGPQGVPILLYLMNVFYQAVAGSNPNWAGTLIPTL